MGEKHKGVTNALTLTVIFFPFSFFLHWLIVAFPIFYLLLVAKISLVASGCWDIQYI